MPAYNVVVVALVVVERVARRLVAVSLVTVSFVTKLLVVVALVVVEFVKIDPSAVRSPEKKPEPVTPSVPAGDVVPIPTVPFALTRKRDEVAEPEALVEEATSKRAV